MTPSTVLFGNSTTLVPEGYAGTLKRKPFPESSPILSVYDMLRLTGDLVSRKHKSDALSPKPYKDSLDSKPYTTPPQAQIKTALPSLETCVPKKAGVLKALLSRRKATCPSSLTRTQDRLHGIYPLWES